MACGFIDFSVMVNTVSSNVRIQKSEHIACNVLINKRQECTFSLNTWCFSQTHRWMKRPAATEATFLHKHPYRPLHSVAHCCHGNKVTNSMATSSLFSHPLWAKYFPFYISQDLGIKKIAFQSTAYSFLLIILIKQKCLKVRHYKYCFEVLFMSLFVLYIQ